MENAQLAATLAPEEEHSDSALDERDDGHRHALPVEASPAALEEADRGQDGEARAEHREARGEAVEPLVEPAVELPCDARAEVEEPEHGGDGDHAAREHRVVVGGEAHDLQEAGGDAGTEQEPPVLADRHDRGRGEHDGCERSADRGQAALEDERRGHEHRADEAERRQRLRLPGEREGEADRGDPRGDGQRSRLRKEVVERRRG